jgi:hypothetical protein
MGSIDRQKLDDAAVVAKKIAVRFMRPQQDGRNRVARLTFWNKLPGG